MTTLAKIILPTLNASNEFQAVVVPGSSWGGKVAASFVALPYLQEFYNEMFIPMCNATTFTQDPTDLSRVIFAVEGEENVSYSKEELLKSLTTIYSTDVSDLNPEGVNDTVVYHAPVIEILAGDLSHLFHDNA